MYSLQNYDHKKWIQIKQNKNEICIVSKKNTLKNAILAHFIFYWISRSIQLCILVTYVVFTQILPMFCLEVSYNFIKEGFLQIDICISDIEIFKGNCLLVSLKHSLQLL